MLMVGLTVFLESCHSTAQYVYIDPRDGKTYKTVKIGTQLWMAENMNYKTAEGSHCFQCKEYGRLYEWNAAQEACPDGWHLPTKAEWNILFSNRHAKNLKSYEDWYNAEATDRYGFSILPTGRYDDGKLSNRGNFAQFWSADIDEGPTFMPRGDVKWSGLPDQNVGVSVRCVRGNKKDVVRMKKHVHEYDRKVEYEDYQHEKERDVEEKNDEKELEEKIKELASEADRFRNRENRLFKRGVLKDPRDGNSYRTVKIGNQNWMAENLRFDDGRRLLDEEEQISANCYNWDEKILDLVGPIYDFGPRPNPENVLSEAGVNCPEGWHIPSAVEWDTLFNTLHRLGFTTYEELSILLGGKYRVDHYDRYYQHIRDVYKNDNSCSWYNELLLEGGIGEYAMFLTDETPYYFQGEEDDKYIIKVYRDSVKKILERPVAATEFVTAASIRCVENHPTGSFKDSRDGTVYKTVKYGKRTWMAENLKYKTKDSFCYDDIKSNCDKFGRLYTHAAAQKACPAGWRLPTVDDVDYFPKGTSYYSYMRFRARNAWNDNLSEKFTSDAYSFSLLPAGRRDIDGRYLNGSGYAGFDKTYFATFPGTGLWTSSIDPHNRYDDDYFFFINERMELKVGSEFLGLSVRCVKK